MRMAELVNKTRRIALLSFKWTTLANEFVHF